MQVPLWLPRLASHPDRAPHTPHAHLVLLPVHSPRPFVLSGLLLEICTCVMALVSNPWGVLGAAAWVCVLGSAA